MYRSDAKTIEISSYYYSSGRDKVVALISIYLFFSPPLPPDDDGPAPLPRHRRMLRQRQHAINLSERDVSLRRASRDLYFPSRLGTKFQTRRHAHHANAFQYVQ